MKIFLGNTPVNSMRVIKHDVSTNDATMKASDLQAGITAYAKGKKITGTGKSFEFAYYGQMKSNDSLFIPDSINVVQVSTTTYPMLSTTMITDTKNLDFSTPQVIGNVIVNNVVHPINITVLNNEISISCDETIVFEIFFGKDNYI